MGNCLRPPSPRVDPIPVLAQTEVLFPIGTEGTFVFRRNRLQRRLFQEQSLSSYAGAGARGKGMCLEIAIDVAPIRYWG